MARGFLAVLMLPALLATAGATSAIIGNETAVDDSLEAPAPCRPDEFGHLCEWLIDTTGEPERDAWTFDLPDLGPALATLTVTFEGQDLGWQVRIDETGGAKAVPVSVRTLAADVHEPGHGDVSLHLVPGVPDRGYELTLTPSAPLPGSNVVPGIGRSLGTYRIHYFAEPVPSGEPPVFPAATRDDPHMLDLVGDARSGHFDLVAAWFDDALLGDGLMDAYLAIGELPASKSATAKRNTSAPSWPGTEYVLMFRVDGIDYVVRWTAEAGGRDATGSVVWSCEFGQRHAPSAMPFANPWCEADAEDGVLRATFPERAVGNPAPGTRFGGVRAESWSASTFAQELEDTLADFVRPFVAGGPEEWAAAALEPEEVVTVTAPANAPRSASVAPSPAVLASVITAVVVSVFVFTTVLAGRAQRREVVEGLIASIDHALRQHDGNPGASLVALGDLDADFDARLRDRRITRAQHRAVRDRIAEEAARIVLRRGTD